MRLNFRNLCLSLVLVMILLLNSSHPVSAAGNIPADVPPSHWAYKAVMLLIDKGYLQLYQDQTFQGEKPVDRYTLASIVAKILIDTASGQTSLSQDELSTLKNLINEFHGELIEIIAKNKEQDQRLDTLEKQNIIDNNEVTEAKAQLMELQNEVAGLNTQLQTLQNELKKTRQRQTWYIIGAVIIGLFGVLK